MAAYQRGQKKMKFLKSLVSKHVKVGINGVEAKAIAKSAPLACSGPVLGGVLSSCGILPVAVAEVPELAMIAAAILTFLVNAARKTILRKGGSLPQ